MRPTIPILVAALALPGAAAASTSHAGWPPITTLLMNRDDQSRPLDGRLQPDGHNELLGGHGSDTIHAGVRGDVLWGDYKPSTQPTTQRDRIDGGPGKDFIYASHGRNTITTGGGSDQIHAHFGRGSITCTGGGHPTVFLSHRSRPHYRLRGCTRISYRTVGY